MIPILSIIVPNYNHSAFLKQRLDSIFNQTYKDYEVILLDDASTDKSIEVLNEYASHPKTAHFIINEVNSGSTFKQWDKGIGLARGEYIWIAESDDFCESSFLEEVIKPFGEDPNIAISFCQSHRTNSLGKITGNWITHTSHQQENPFVNDFKMDGNRFIEKYLVHKNVIPNVSAVLFKKENLEKIIPLTFKPFMKYNADWYYYIQILCNSKVAFIANSLNHFRYHGESVIARAEGESGWIKIFKMELLGRKQMFEYLRNCNPPNLTALKEQLNKGNETLHLLTAKGYVDRGDIFRAFYVILNKPKLWYQLIIYTSNKNRPG